MQIKSAMPSIQNRGATVANARRWTAVGSMLVLLLGCGVMQQPPQDQKRGAETHALPAMQAWQPYALPGKQATTYTFLHHEGRDAMQAHAKASASMLRHQIQVATDDLGTLRFSWKVPRLIDRADMGSRELDDSPVRVILVFDGDRSRFSMKNTMLSELSSALTGEPLPYATLMYVWCNTCSPGSVIINPRTDRIRKVVVESGEGKLGHWLDYERDIRKDFEHAFGEMPGALLGIAIMTDTDNTRSDATAWYGPLWVTRSRG